MGALDKWINFMKLNDDSDDGDYLDDDYYDEGDAGSGSKSNIRNIPRSEEEDEEEDRVRKAPSKVTNIRQARKPGSSGMEVCVIKPTSFEEAREITETLLANRTVVLNMEGLDMEVAQRIIDFTSGSCYAINGNLQKISRFIFIITPASVDISGDFQQILNDSLDMLGV